MLWVRGHYWPGEIILIANLFNLTSLYFRHSKTPLFVHIPIVSGAYAWNYIAILWNGAAMVNATSLPARILANITIWGILVLGAFFIFTFKDYTMGINLSILTLGKSKLLSCRRPMLTPSQHWRSVNSDDKSSHSSGSSRSS
jgi:hypothetical protein